MSATRPTLPFSCIDIAVCTFRRPELERTLRSLANIDVPADSSVRIIVADNDVVPSAAGLVENLRAEIPFGIDYIHCPASNISIARNACLDQSRGEFLAFIDDDETASPEWLVRLVETMSENGADVVLGPVKAQYGTAPKWMRRADLHSTRPVWVGGEIRTGYTCNVLLRLTARPLAGRRFSLSLGRTGGEDTEFFSLAKHAGARIAFAPTAWVHEPVTESRATFAWLARRRYRMGQTHGRLLADRPHNGGRVAQVGLAAAKSLFCAGACIATAFFPAQRYRYALRAIMHAGAVSGLMGVREIEQYGLPETRTS
ncbi:glycosyltransferase family 2 protein [Rhizobium sp. ARZ01]|uniref:glycosyltransferase n=1 Tax=Rhizobium sp. ARZ01 TaxID=2769313 RepID=UPI001786531A|nr:glycosyltransferase family 2 protein [Rhizobium sp. ARZ01]MBD9375297.1 glycosyltransferase family 2 protein [Rhizobium sp. ARZ01]